MDLELAGRAFLITGGSDGLGQSLAHTLLGEGASVAICGRDETRLARAREELGPEALCWRADVTKSDELDEFIDAAVARFGRIDGVVNNAGRSSALAVEESSDEQWREDFELKVVAAVHLVRRTINELTATHGSVLNVLTVMARAPRANSTPTAATRAAGLALTKALAAELGPRGVRANALLVGFVESGQWRRRAAEAGVAPDEFYASIAREAAIPLGRLGRGNEFADVAAFLLSPRASYLSGVGLNVDGGLSPVT